jgi:hypothetical protein
MAQKPPHDLEEKVAIMREFRRRRDAGEPIPDELRAAHVNATNDGYATEPERGERIPDYSLLDQTGFQENDSRSYRPERSFSATLPSCLLLR